MRRSLIYILGIAIIGLVIACNPTRKGRLNQNREGQPTNSITSQLQSIINDSSALDIKSLLEDSTLINDGTLANIDSIADTDSTLWQTIPSDSVSSKTAVLNNSINLNELKDTLSTKSDSLQNGRTSFKRIRREKVDLDNMVNFSAKDSLVMLGQNNAFMYGEGNVTYGDIKLNAGQIKMEMDSTTVYAIGTTDSIGETSGNPIFSDRGGEYESKSMKYNFKTQRGYITDVITEQGEGYLQGGAAKKMEDGSFFVKDGKYTTCDDHECPHFYMQLTKAKIKPKKNIVTGPAYMVLADVPLPLALPFGYFPFSKDYSSGIIFPTFGEDYNRGFYMRDGGYYFALSDYVDLALRGEIYTKGSWGINAHSSYVKRYKFKGSFDLSYITTVVGDKGSADYSKQNNFKISWTHTQDAKANPNMNFSASVDFATSGYSRNDLNSYYNNSFTENTKSSTVNMTYRFPGTKWSISATANVSQRTQDSTLSVSLPNLTITLSQVAPFKRKRKIGGEKWYEKIKLSYSGQFQNSLTAHQDEFFKKNLIKDWRNGMKHSVPISATFNLFKYINISPSITLNDRMYFNKVRREWDPAASAEVTDTVFGFYNVFDFNAAISMDTKLYGFYKPMKFLGDKVQMIRHVLTPSISFSASPDFSAPFWGYYDSYSYTNAAGQTITKDYTYFQNAIFGVPGRGKSGIVSVNLANNIEMKVKSDADSTGVKKISIIENFTIGQSYNFAADSLNWSNINTSILLRLAKNFNFNISATWDPYTYQLSPSGSPVRVNKTRLQAGKGWARLSSTGTSFSYTFNNDTFKRKKDNSSKTAGDNPNSEENDDMTATENESDMANRRRKNNNNNTSESDADGYEKWEIPWNLTFNYSINYGYGAFNKEKMEYDSKITQNLSLNGSIRPTKNWNFNFSASYNFETKKLAYMNCSISRDLHCFTMTASFVPVGPYKSYNFHIGVKSSMLKDLKYDKRSSTSNGISWY